MTDSEGEPCGNNNRADIFQSVLETSRFFTSIVELIPGKFYLKPEEDVYESKPVKKRKIKPENKKLLAKKAKLFKLDPGQHKSILELQKEIESKEEELCNADSNVSNTEAINVSNIESASLDDLRERMQKKLKKLRGNRKILNKDDKEKTRLEKRKIDHQKRKKQEKSASFKVVNDIESKAMSINEDSKNGHNVQFSKFDFASEVPKGFKKKKKDLKKLLDVAEKKQNRINKLQETDIEKADVIKKKISWDSALKKAEGVKIKDDPKLIKRTIKKKEKLKNRSQKKWADRKETVEKQVKEKQLTRKRNIKERKEVKISKKIGKKKKAK